MNTIGSTSKQQQEKNLEIKYIQIDENVEIYADSNRLEQVLTNLISNAIKFTENGDIEITTRIINARDIQYDNCFEDEIKRLQKQIDKINSEMIK